MQILKNFRIYTHILFKIKDQGTPDRVFLKNPKMSCITNNLLPSKCLFRKVF